MIRDVLVSSKAVGVLVSCLLEQSLPPLAVRNSDDEAWYMSPLLWASQIGRDFRALLEVYWCGRLFKHPPSKLQEVSLHTLELPTYSGDTFLGMRVPVGSSEGPPQAPLDSLWGSSLKENQLEQVRFCVPPTSSCCLHNCGRSMSYDLPSRCKPL